MTMTGLLLFTIKLGRDLKSIWLIQLGTAMLSGAFWWPAVRYPTLTRLHLLSGFLTWWIPLSWVATYAIWQSAFVQEEFWIPQLIAIADVGYVLLRFVITPLSCNVLIMGIILMRRGPTWSSLFGTIFGILPFALLVIMESTGHIRW